MKGYQTHESFWADYKLYCKMIVRALRLGFIAQIILLAIVFYQVQDEINHLTVLGTNIKMPITVALKYYTGYGGIRTGSNIPVEVQLRGFAKNNTILPLNAYRGFVDQITDDAYKDARDNMIEAFYRSFAAYVLSVMYLAYFIVTARQKQEETFLRGAKITPLKILNKKLAKEASKNLLSCLTIGNTILPYDMESKHILILGTSGSGKGVLLNQLTAQLTARKVKYRTQERCIFYDLKGEFVAKQYNSKVDHIFCPFDTRSLGWNLFNEIEIPPDYDVIAKSLFLSPDSKSEYWYNCAKDVFRTGLVYLKRKSMTSNKELWEFFSQSLEHMQAAFKTLPLGERGALKHIDKEDSPASASIVSILQERIHFFYYLVDMDGDFSFRKFVRQQKKSVDDPFQIQPNLYILNIEQYKSIFKPLMTLAIDTMIRETLSLPDDLNRRIFFILDELGSLYKMDSILELETAGRSKGACLICASQDLGRIEENYGKANLKTFYNNFNTNFTFRVREPETAEFLSKAIGEQNVIKQVQSRQMSPNEIGDRKSISDQEKTERLILPTEFQELIDLRAIINIANFGIASIDVPPLYYTEVHPNFILRQFSETIEEPQAEKIEQELEAQEEQKKSKKAIKSKTDARFDLSNV